MALPSKSSITKRPGSIGGLYGGTVTNIANYIDTDVDTYGSIYQSSPNTDWVGLYNFGFAIPAGNIISGFYLIDRMAGIAPTPGSSAPTNFHRRLSLGAHDPASFYSLGTEKTTGDIKDLPYGGWPAEYFTNGNDSDRWGCSITDLSVTNVNSTNFGFAQKFDHRTGGMTINYYDTQATIYYYTPIVAELTTSSASSITKTGFIMAGDITEDGFYDTDGSCSRRGFCYKLASSAGDPTTADTVIYDDGTYREGAFSKTLTSLTQGEKYKIRAYAVNSIGTGYGTTVEVQLLGWKDPANAYSSGDNYTTSPAADGVLKVDLSKDGGVNWQSILTQTYTGSDSAKVYGTGSTELWGSSWTRASMTDANFRLRIMSGTNEQIYKGFGFATGTENLTGIEVSIEGNYNAPTIFIDHIKVKIYYGTSTLPVQAGSQTFATDGRKPGEGAGAGTGVLCFYDGTGWKSCIDGAAISA